MRQALETALIELVGKPVGVLVRTAEQMAAVLRANPFPDAPGNQECALFLPAVPGPDTLAELKGLVRERSVSSR